MQKRSPKLESTQKLSKTGHVEIFLLWSKSQRKSQRSTINSGGQRSTINYYVC